MKFHGFKKNQTQVIFEKLQMINVSSLLDTTFTEAFEEQVEAFGKILDNTQFQLRKETLVVVIKVSENRLVKICLQMTQCLWTLDTPFLRIKRIVKLKSLW